MANKKLKLGIIGLGNMGSTHCRLLETIPGIELAAVCDIDQKRLGKIHERFGGVPFADADAMLDAHVCEAVLIATPHYSHTTIGIRALQLGYHVMVEKPVSVHKADAQKLINAHRNPDQVFAAMFNQRTNPAYQKIREMLNNGELGELRRLQWTITDWFRSQAYYDSGGWRATWGGEGGGVLLNQCPHQLDLLQWLFGMPVSLRAFTHLGKHHNIEVDDEVTTYLEYENGATGLFVTTTGEAPGSNRLEIAAEHGRLVYDTSQKYLEFVRNDKPVSRAIAENPGFSAPQTTTEKIRISGTGKQHAEVLDNFAKAIAGKAELIAPAQEGIKSVELANAMLLSGWSEKTVSLPISARRYTNQLRTRIEGSTLKKVVKEAVMDDMSSTF